MTEDDSAASTPAAATAAPGSGPGAADLVRGLSVTEATSIVVGGIIGSGIFISPAIVAREVGAPGLSLLVWVVAGIVATCGALCYAELGAMLPVTGGTYVYLRRAYRLPMLAFLFGWAMFFAGFTGAIAAVATAFAEYVGFFLSALGAYGTLEKRAVAVGCIALLTALNYLSTRWGGRIQNVATGLKVAALLAIVGVAIAVGAGGSWDRFEPLLPAAAPELGLVAAFGTAMIPALFAFNGWSYASYVAGEVARPQRSLPIAIIGGTAIVLLVYLLVNVAFIYLVPFDVLQTTSRPAAEAMVRAVGPTGGALVALAVAVSTFGAANAVMLSCARTYFAMARDGLFFEAVGRVHPRWGTPHNAVLVQGIIAAAFAVSGSFEQILTYYAFIDFAFFTLAVAAVLILRRTEPDLPRPFRVWGYPFTPLVFLGVSAWYLFNTLVHRPVESAVGIVLTLIGVPFYVYWSRRRPRRSPEP